MIHTTCSCSRGQISPVLQLVKWAQHAMQSCGASLFMRLQYTSIAAHQSSASAKGSGSPHTTATTQPTECSSCMCWWSLKVSCAVAGRERHTCHINPYMHIPVSCQLGMLLPAQPLQGQPAHPKATPQAVGPAAAACRLAWLPHCCCCCLADAPPA